VTEAERRAVRAAINQRRRQALRLAPPSPSMSRVDSDVAHLLGLLPTWRTMPTALTSPPRKARRRSTSA